MKNGEAILALQEYMNMRHRVGEMEAIGEDCCSCDPNEFHTCDYCKDLGQGNAELRRLLGLWGDIWATMLAEKMDITPANAAVARGREADAGSSQTEGRLPGMSMDSGQTL